MFVVHRKMYARCGRYIPKHRSVDSMGNSLTVERCTAISRVTFRDVFRIREIRWLWFAEVQSLLGDQLARVALSVLVYERTGSGLLTAAVYALSFLPAVAGAVMFGWLADQLPRRSLMIGCDVLRAGLLVVMAWTAQPLWLLSVLLVVVVLVSAPFSAAQSALVADIVTGETYSMVTSVRIATFQAAQLVGFAIGGAVVAGIGARVALLIDGVTFLASAALIRSALRPRPAPDAGGELRPRAAVARLRAGVRIIAGDRQLRQLVGFAWLAGLYVVPEGLAAPYAAAVGGGPAAVGLLLAAGPAGAMVGALIYARFVPRSARAWLLGPLAVAAGVPLLLCWTRPGLAAAITLWALSGVMLAYQLQANAEFVEATDAARRGQAFALASSGLIAVQGIGFVIGGLLAQLWEVGPAVAAAGGIGSVLAVLLTISRTRLGHQGAVQPAGAPA
jgi:predicted MFS family arabinose efflux permease